MIISFRLKNIITKMAINPSAGEKMGGMIGLLPVLKQEPFFKRHRPPGREGF